MKLYYMPGACSLASHIVLHWLGRPHDTQRLSREELKQPAYLKINPQGAVPALQLDDGTVLTQNVSVLEYLAEQDAGKALLGDGSSAQRAETRRWLGVVNADLHKAFKPIFGAEKMVKDPASQEELRQGAIGTIVDIYGLIDKRLEGRSYLVGEKPTVADAYLYVVTRWTRAKKIDLSRFANVAAFFERMDKDPAVIAALQAEA